MKLGTSYCPETYDSSAWRSDLTLMKESGLEVIRISLPKTYHALWQRGIPVDVVAPLENLAGYKLVVISSLQLIDQQTADQLAAYVHDGGILWACAPFAQRDQHAKWLQDRSTSC